jgi:hypothetical protein
MDQLLTWAMVGVGTIVVALSGAVQKLWTKMIDCERDHATCRETTASLKAENKYQGCQIQESQGRITKLEGRISEIVRRNNVEDSGSNVT